MQIGEGGQFHLRRGQGGRCGQSRLGAIAGEATAMAAALASATPEFKNGRV